MRYHCIGDRLLGTLLISAGGGLSGFRLDPIRQFSRLVPLLDPTLRRAGPVRWPAPTTSVPSRYLPNRAGFSHRIDAGNRAFAAAKALVSGRVSRRPMRAWMPRP